MKNQKCLKKIITLSCIFCLSAAAVFSPAATLSVQASTAETVTPRSDDIRYRFKEENGKLYKRLFNYTRNEWVGDWIYVADL